MQSSCLIHIKTIIGTGNNIIGRLEMGFLNNQTICKKLPKKTFVHKIIKIREKYKDVLETPDWNGLEIPRDEPSEEDYDKKIKALWEKA